MKKMSKVMAAAAAVSSILMLASCGGKKEVTVRYLNFKPEVANVYQELAAAYEKETGVKVIVETAANNQYEATLMSKMATKDAPTLFQINGPRGYANWKDYCADLSNTEIYRHLSDTHPEIAKSFADTASFILLSLRSAVFTKSGFLSSSDPLADTKGSVTKS